MLALLLLIVSSALVFYFLIGYPLLLSASRRSAPAIRKDPSFQPTVSIIMAVHNGEQFIGRKLESLLALDYPTRLREILVISDGSTDATEAIAATFADRGVRLLRVPRGGKASALNAGLAQATGEILFFTDVRQALDPKTLAHLTANFADPTIGAVTGELRLLNPAKFGEQADMELYWRLELWARALHSRIDSIFSVTGCVYALRRSLAQPLPADTIADDGTFSLRAFFSGYRVVYDPEAIAFDYPAAPGGEFRRRWRTLAGLWQIFTRMPQLFTSADRMRFHFLSYKFGRLVLPWAILLILGSTLALPASSWRNFLLIDEAMLPLLATLDRFVPKRFPLKRVSSPARTFLSMNAASMLAVLIFFLPPEVIWRPTQMQIHESAGKS
jgi:cellulose synthase/poly-beta-1,6-N-acetylglucosamine synthase-like glycosyltransferase